MSYVANGKTYDEGGNEVDAFGHPLGGFDPKSAQNQPLSATAAAMGHGSSASGGATIEDVTGAPAGGGYGSTVAGTGGYHNIKGGASGAADGGFDSTIREGLLAQLAADQVPATIADPTLNPQAAAFKTAQNSAAEDAKNALAERALANGTFHSGGSDVEQNQLQNTVGQNNATFQADLVGRESAARRSDAANLLGIGTAASTADLNRAEQALESSRQLDLSKQLGLGDLDLRKILGSGQLDLGLLQTLLGNQQSNNNLGFNYANLGYNENRDLILNGIMGK